MNLDFGKPIEQVININLSSCKMAGFANKGNKLLKILLSCLRNWCGIVYYDVIAFIVSKPI